MRYYIAENGQPAGPFEANELMAHGLTVNSLVWAEGMPNWTSASQVPELMAVLSGQPVNVGMPGGFDTQLPPVGGTPSQMPQVPPFNTQPTQYGTPYGQGTSTGNQPYAQPQYGPSSNTPSRQVMPKTWLTESVLVTVLSMLCLCNIVALIPGIVSIVKANSVKTKFMQGDYDGAQNASASAKKWVLITVVVMIVWSCYQAYTLLSNPQLLQQIQEQAGLYGMMG